MAVSPLMEQWDLSQQTPRSTFWGPKTALAFHLCASWTFVCCGRSSLNSTRALNISQACARWFQSATLSPSSSSRPAAGAAHLRWIPGGFIKMVGPGSPHERASSSMGSSVVSIKSVARNNVVLLPMKRIQTKTCNKCKFEDFLYLIL